eukprot:1161761-Pelagomonas_calceolata.AAC.7
MSSRSESRCTQHKQWHSQHKQWNQASAHSMSSGTGNRCAQHEPQVHTAQAVGFTAHGPSSGI